MRSESTLRRWIKRLRAEIDSTNDPAVRRLAYAMETVLRVAISKRGDFGWYKPVEDVRELAGFLKEEIGR